MKSPVAALSVACRPWQSARRCRQKRAYRQERRGFAVGDEEMAIVKDVPAFIELLRGRRLFVPSKAWSDFADQIEMPDLGFHALRHTHASQLIDAGVDIVTISKRLGHGMPDITLRIYAHLFRKDDSKAAAINEALNG
jgi:integrase